MLLYYIGWSNLLWVFRYNFDNTFGRVLRPPYSESKMCIFMWSNMSRELNSKELISLGDSTVIPIIIYISITYTGWEISKRKTKIAFSSNFIVRATRVRITYDCRLRIIITIIYHVTVNIYYTGIFTFRCISVP